MKPTIMIDVSDVDWRLLRKQKRALASEVAYEKGSPELEGLLSFLDDVMDQAALCIGEKKVFGRELK